MKILLTGQPGIGKSSVIWDFMSLYRGDMHGVLASAIQDENHRRVGFQAATPDGRSAVFAHKYAISSKIQVGRKYHVDVGIIDSFIVPEIRQGMASNGIILIDEIGRMQAHSALFMAATRSVLGSDHAVLGSIVYDDESWAVEFKTHPAIILVEVTPRNRVELPHLLLDIYENVESFRSLSERQKVLARAMLWVYFREGRSIQVHKLFQNAIPYVRGERVEECGAGFLVGGNRASRTVLPEGAGYRCGCPLFLGEGSYEGKPGECSHVQAVRLFVAG